MAAKKIAADEGAVFFSVLLPISQFANIWLAIKHADSKKVINQYASLSESSLCPCCKKKKNTHKIPDWHLILDILSIPMFFSRKPHTFTLKVTFHIKVKRKINIWIKLFNQEEVSSYYATFQWQSCGCLHLCGNQDKRLRFTDYLFMLSDHPGLKTEWKYCIGERETYASHEHAWWLWNLLPHTNNEV